MIIFQITVERLDAVVRHLPELIHRGTQQVAVMRHDNDRAIKTRQGFGECLTHFQIKVVGRLIKQQQIGLLPGHQRQCQARLLASGKAPHFTKGIIPLKAEATEKVANFLVAGGGGKPLYMDKRRHRRIKPFQLVLGKVADSQMLPGDTLARQQRQFTGQGFDQGRFTGAIGSEQPDPLARQ